MTLPQTMDFRSLFPTPAAIAVLRTPSARTALDMADALAKGGLAAIEVTLTTPGACEVIEELSARPGLIVGAGTVTNTVEAADAVKAGARFVVTPGLVTRVISAVRDRGVPVVPGVFTPSELLAARACGATTVKLFPASTGGVTHLKALRSVFPSIGLVPTGGIGPADVADWITAGACAVGVGGVLNNTYDKDGCDGLQALAADLVGRTDAAASRSEIRKEHDR